MSKPTDDSELDEILQTLRIAAFKHGMEVGQEFPEENPEKLHDPCNAEDVERAKQAIQRLVLEARMNEIEMIDMGNQMYPANRLAQLRKQLEEVNNDLQERGRRR